jgi:hypothetical protein
VIVSIWKFSGDLSIDQLIEASVTKKRWWGKRNDIYWEFLDSHANEVSTEFNAHIFADMFAYLLVKLEFKEQLEKYSARLSKNRGGFAMIIGFEDTKWLLDKLALLTFLTDFKTYAKELNAEFYDYEDGMLEKTIADFKVVLSDIGNDGIFLINVG